MTSVSFSILANVVDGGVPPVGSDVNVASHVVVRPGWDVDEIVVQDGGTLEWDASQSVELLCRKLTALPGSTVLRRPASGMIKHTLKIRSEPDCGVLVHGRWDDRGEVKAPYMRCLVEPRAGDATVVLEGADHNWRVGDRVVLPDSRQWQTYYSNWWLPQDQLDQWGVPGWGGPDHVEQRIIAAIDGDVITLDQPLAKDHPGARFLDEAPAEALPHVVNLTRNVKTVSQTPSSEYRGFVEVRDRAEFTSHYVEYRGLGQSTISTKGPTYGNHRTPLCLHHLYGPVGGLPSGYSAEVVGCSFWCGMKDHWYKGPSHHDTHYSLWRDCVAFNWAGWSFAGWHGNESYNRFERCFALLGHGHGDNVGSPGETGEESAGFYAKGPNDSYVDCVTANCMSVYGFGFAAYGFKINNVGGTHPIPTALGCPSFEQKDLRALPLQEWRGLEMYGQENGITLWFINASNSAIINPAAKSWITDVRLWNVAKYGAFFYPTAGITCERWWARNRRYLMDKQPSLVLESGDYYAGEQVLRDFDVKGWRGCWSFPTYGDSQHLAERVASDCWWDFTWHMVGAPGSGGHGSNRRARQVIMRDCVASDKTGWTSDHIGSPSRILVVEDLWFAPNVVVLDKLTLENWDGHDYELFRDTQSGNAITPQTDNPPGLYGSPVAGLTNLENLDQHGVCRGGQIMPPAAAPLAWFTGGKATQS